MKTQHLEVNNYNSLIFVEGKNDKSFLEIICKNSGVNNDLIKIFDMKGIEGLRTALNSNITDLKSREITKIGFVFDTDGSTVDDKLTLLNGILKEFDLFSGCKMNNSLKTSFKINEKRLVEISMFLMKDSNGKGELIDLLKEIKLQPSDISDCAIKCLKKKDDSIDKELMDDWLHLYLKWDCSSKKDRKNGSKIGLDKEETKVRIEKMFDLQSEKLNPLKTYLKQFSN